jgi:hypothetical protein
VAPGGDTGGPKHGPGDRSLKALEARPVAGWATSRQSDAHCSAAVISTSPKSDSAFLAGTLAMPNTAPGNRHGLAMHRRILGTIEPGRDLAFGGLMYPGRGLAPSTYWARHPMP